MEQSRKRVSKLVDFSDYKYAARQYKDYAIAKEIQDDLKVMVYSIIGDKKQISIQSSETPTNFDVVGKDKKYKWFAYIKPDGYMFFARSEIELYCNIISSIVGNQLYIPFSY